MTQSRSRRAVGAAAAAFMLAFAVVAGAQGTSASPRAEYVNGGISKEEADELRAQASSYPLEITFSRRIDGQDAFAADVEVAILDASGRRVLALPAAKPILLANLPAGRYTVEATFEGRTKRQQVAVGRGHQKLGFSW